MPWVSFRVFPQKFHCLLLKIELNHFTWQKAELGPWTSGKKTSSCLRNCWIESPGKLSLRAWVQNRASSSLRTPFWECKSSLSPSRRNWTEEAGDWHGCARTWSLNWGKRGKCTGSGSRLCSLGRIQGHCVRRKIRKAKAQIELNLARDV